MPRTLAIASAAIMGGLLVLAAIAFFCRSPKDVSRPWPAGLGTIDEVPKRYPPSSETPAAYELIRLAHPLGIDFRPRAQASADMRKRHEKFSAYVKAQLDRNDVSIDAPPAEVASYLAQHRSELDAVRRHLLSGQPIGWKVDLGSETPFPNLIAHVYLARVFAADALSRGDASAWDDLQAIWRLEEGLWDRPDLISHLIALSGTRMTVAAARRLPAPEPAWLEEVRALELRRRFLAAAQADAWSMRREVVSETARGSLPARLFTWKTRSLLGAGMERRRLMAEEIAGNRDCAFDSAAAMSRVQRHAAADSVAGLWMVDLGDTWARFAALPAEIELTDRVFAAKSGAMPSSQSACADGKWIVEKRPDGAIVIRFSRPPRHAADKTSDPHDFVVHPEAIGP